MSQTTDGGRAGNLPPVGGSCQLATQETDLHTDLCCTQQEMAVCKASER